MKNLEPKMYYAWCQVTECLDGNRTYKEKTVIPAGAVPLTMDRVARSIIENYNSEHRSDTFSDMLTDLFGPMDWNPTLKELYFRLVDEIEGETLNGEG